MLPGKLFGGELVQLGSQININSKSSGLEEALLANMDDLSAVEIDSGDDAPQATQAVQTRDED